MQQEFIDQITQAEQEAQAIREQAAADARAAYNAAVEDMARKRQEDLTAYRLSLREDARRQTEAAQAKAEGEMEAYVRSLGQSDAQAQARMEKAADFIVARIVKG